MNDLKRLNVRISDEVNDFLDAESKKTGIAKSSIVQLALTDYMNKKINPNLSPETIDKIKTFFNGV